ncbi:hypothetical protein V2G26_000979 [Clonostachys chloroleuca]
MILEHTMNGIYEYPSRSMALLKRIQATYHDQKFPAERSHVPLRVLVVGAGLVRRSRRRHSNPPNSGRLLSSWGITPFFKNKVVQPDSMTFRRWENGAPIGFTPLVPHFSDTYGAPYYVIHRSHFHADGREFTADLVVAVDGVKSIARPVVLGGVDRPPRQTGFAAYRAVVDTDLMKADPDTAWLLENPGINIWIGEDRHVMTYCIAGGKSFNMVLSHVDRTDPATWASRDAVKEMRVQFENWDPRLTKVIHMITNTIQWPLLSGAQLSTWISESKKVVILGDAAHAMVPYMSQGAAMAVEDGAALAEVLSLIKSPSEIPEALHVFEKERMQRSYGMQRASLVNGKLWHFPDGPDQQARDLGMRAEVEGLSFVESTNQWSDPTTQLWAYGYDAEEEVRKAWESRTSQATVNGGHK